jgi:hypothetical protein
MDGAIKRNTFAVGCMLSSLAVLLASLLLAGCATRSYPGPIHGLTFDGTAQAIDLTNQSLTLSPLKPAQPVVFAWTRNTKFWKNGIPMRREEVEPGVSARVHFHLATASEVHFAVGQYVANHVYVQVPYAPMH